MSIDRTTYELYIMDYLDGRLDAVAVSELLLFLEQNPDLKEEFEGMRNFTLDKNSDAPALDKSFLKKPSYDEVKHLYEPMLIARMEGDETEQEVLQLNKAELLYPGLKKDETLFLQTRLVPDLHVVYKNKSQLKVFTLAAYYKPAMRVAAILLCISAIGLFIYRNNNQQVGNPTTNSTQNKTVPALPVKPGKDIAAKTSPKKDELNAKGHVLTIARNDQPKAIQQHTPVINNTQVVKNEQLHVLSIDAKIKQTVAEVNTPVFAEPEQIAYRQPKPVLNNAAEPEYLDFKTWVARRIQKETSTESENTLLAKINRVTNADIVLEKDTTGKITRFEIAGLGFALR